MKVSLNLAQYYSNVELSKIGKDKLFQKIGEQLGAIEEIKEWGPRYDGVVVAKVISCNPHPNADKLQICMIDDAKVAKSIKRDIRGHVQVVCGAPNVAPGMLVAWIPPGVTVPATIDTQPLKLDAREIRGEFSYGMLASANELGISDDHAGILEILAKEVGSNLARAGTEFKKLYGLDDTVIDIENKMFTHRPDCFGVLGVARELAGIQGLSFKSPKWYLATEKKSYRPGKHKLKVTNDVTKHVPRFMAQVVEDVTVGPSPVWLQACLTRVGIKPINNIVDLSNYYMHLTGQPTHAFDYDKLSALSNNVVTLGPRLARAGEKLTLLGGKVIDLTKDDLVIATDETPVALAGVMGGSDTEVDFNTKTIVIEVATFDMYSIRRTSMRHGLFTDAVTRFNKGQSPLQNGKVLSKIVSDMHEAGATPTSQIFDIKSRRVSKLQSVRITPQFVNERLGSNLSAKIITKLLENVEFRVTPIGKQLVVSPPFWRTDIEIAEDLVEEIGRLFGYDKLEVELPQRTIMPVKRDELLTFKSRLRSKLSSLGANELLTYSFVHENILIGAQQNPKKAFKLSNALSPDLQYFRTSLTPSLLEKVYPNIRAGYNNFALYEIGKSHDKASIEDGLPKEHELLSLVNYRSNTVQAGYYEARKLLDNLASMLELEFTFSPIKNEIKSPVYEPFDPERSALVVVGNSDEVVGIVGEYKRSVKNSFKLPDKVSGFELDIKGLLRALLVTGPSYSQLSKYPSVEQDLTLSCPDNVNFANLSKTVQAVTNQISESTGLLIAFWATSIYQKQNEKHKNTSFRFKVASSQRTLTTQEVSQVLDDVAKSVEEDLGAKRV